VPKPRGKDYIEYDELFEDAYFEAPVSSKPKPKRKRERTLPGIVVRARGHHFDVETPEGTLVCQVRGRLLQEAPKDTTLVAVGDRVQVLPTEKGQGLIDRVEERRTVLSRRRPGTHRPVEDVILANPDQVLVVFAVRQPKPNLRMLDRFLVVAEANELPATVVANKVDLADLEEARRLFGLYQEIGYRVLYTSAITGQGVDELRELLTDRVTVVTGPSGVGKSALINALHPALNLRVGEISQVLGKGRHTTRAAHLIRLPFGERTYIADTPGIRELGLVDIQPSDLGFYFVEMAPYAQRCRFPDCTHTHEPGCAVRQAVEAGAIPQQRYESYLHILAGEDLQPPGY